MIDPNSEQRNPLDHPEQWEDELLGRYPTPSSTKSDSEFRDYEAEQRPSVKEFYRLNHRYQTVAFVQQKRREFLSLDRRRMGVWEAMEFLNTLVDDSDPDTELTQIEHLLQTAEAVRHDGRPDWFILTGLIHDLGKILCLDGEPQWAVVGDTFPVGCAYSKKIVYHDFFQANPDWVDSRYNSQFGVYKSETGLDNVLMSWGHDEYLYHVIKDYLPIEAQYMIRYHSFYPAHRERDYEYLFDERDHAMFDWVREFNQYDLYSKAEAPPDVERLKPYYEQLIGRYFPSQIAW
jgi:inositol oxygenase